MLNSQVSCMLSTSVLIPTYNRAAILSETLLALTQVQRTDTNVQWIIIDNNSNDATRAVVAEFAKKLNLAYLFEPRPGKNRALNQALTQCALGDIVVFTDDDVTPGTDWLSQIARSCLEYPEYSVFRGRIIPQWPVQSEALWAQDRFIQAFGFARHDYGPGVQPYPAGSYPFGPNFWVRREVFRKGFTFDERVGPRPANRIMGSETRFLINLATAGYAMLYYPGAKLRHRIQKAAYSPKAIHRRALSLGRAGIYLSGLPRPRLREKCPAAWVAYLLVKMAYASVLRVCSVASFSEKERLRRAVNALTILGNALESLRAGGSVVTKPPSANRGDSVSNEIRHHPELLPAPEGSEEESPFGLNHHPGMILRNSAK